MVDPVDLVDPIDPKPHPSAYSPWSREEAFMLTHVLADKLPHVWADKLAHVSDDDQPPPLILHGPADWLYQTHVLDQDLPDRTNPNTCV